MGYFKLPNYSLAVAMGSFYDHEALMDVISLRKKRYRDEIEAKRNKVLKYAWLREAAAIEIQRKVRRRRRRHGGVQGGRSPPCAFLRGRLTAPAPSAPAASWPPPSGARTGLPEQARPAAPTRTRGLTRRATARTRSDLVSRLQWISCARRSTRAAAYRFAPACPTSSITGSPSSPRPSAASSSAAASGSMSLSSSTASLIAPESPLGPEPVGPSSSSKSW